MLLCLVASVLVSECHQSKSNIRRVRQQRYIDMKTRNIRAAAWRITNNGNGHLPLLVCRLCPASYGNRMTHSCWFDSSTAGLTNQCPMSANSKFQNKSNGLPLEELPVPHVLGTAHAPT